MTGRCGSRSLPRRCRGWLALAALALCACGRQPSASGPGAAPRPSALTLRPLASPAGRGSSEPKLSAAPDGTVVLSWVEPIGDGLENQLRFARWNGAGWDAPRVAASGANWFVNPSDTPAVQPIAGNLWATHWRLASEDGEAYDAIVAVSADAGASFSAPQKLNDDGTATEHGFVSLFQWKDGVGAVWLDGRDTAREDGGGGAPLGTSLRYALLGSDGSIAEQGVVDSLVCDCCTTGAAATGDGVAVVYRDRTPDEIRDIVVRRERRGEWSEPVQAGPDGWRIEGCPINGPAIAAVGDRVAVAWFTAPDGRARVRFASSADGGSSFAAAVDVDAERPIGHVGVALEERAAHVTWWRRDPSGGAQFVTRAVGADGVLGPVTIIATSTSTRPDDVPQIVRAGTALLFAWTQEDGDAQGVRTAAADIGGR